ncbi:phage tail protein [Myxococcus qinghaiensis]|uniref:phage tail protein n=1 Tax=Myxococcus qinghaiensis TaxID=2906758 RepID=UPI0020A6F7F4|nr:hypothetical protein [Myxococcus qinghaiensis]MCP3169235.1 hypothetical protein [Myxococcus qinghaiensis]
MPPARASARPASRAPARGAAPARAGATSAAAPGGAAIKVGGDAEKDPRFRKVIEQLKKSSDKTKKHPPASQKAAEAQAAAVSPPTEQLAGAKGNQVDAMKAAEAPKTEPNGFLAMLRAEIEKVMPKTLDDADSFMEGNETAQVKDSVAGGVSETKQAATGPTEAATAAAPDPSGVPARQASAMPSEPAPESLPVNGAEAMPAPKPNTQVQALQKGKQDADQQMKDAELTPDQLKKANDPRFSKVLSEKGQVEKTAGAAPGKYRASETGTLGQAKAKAGGDARAGVAQMAGVRVSGNSKVKTRQLLAKQKDEARRKEVTANIERMYQQTKQRVDSRLSTLEADVMRMFDLGAEAALSDMKSYADREIEKFKDDRYSGLTGKARWVADLFRPVPEGIKVILGQARTRFASKMDALAVRISTTVDNRLAQAKADVDKGQAAIKTYVDSLPRDLQGVGQEAQKAVGERFDELRSGIDAKKNDLAQKLAQKYKEAFDKADAALKKLEEENAGALKKLADAIGEVIKILTEFKDKLMALLRKGWETIKLILADPIGFLSNLISAIKLGVQQFLGNIQEHLVRGFMKWLFGALAQAGIPIPTDLTLPSILKLVLAVLGITYERMRAKAVKLMGERTVGLMEKVFELVRTLVTSGPEAMWEQMKENLGNLEAMVIESLKTWLIETVVKQAITKIISMFNPAGAIIQAVLAIYNTVMFFIERASQIMSLIEAIINSVHSIATGAIGDAANWIEQALGRAVPVVISFLARLIGLGGISNKIKETIQKAQGMVDRAIDKVLAKLVALAKRLFGRGGRGQSASANAREGRRVRVQLPLSMHHEGHTLYAELQGNQVIIKMASSRLEVLKVLAAGAISKERAGANRPKLIKRLEKVYSKLSATESDLRVAVINSDKDAEYKLLKSIEDIANNLRMIGGEFNLNDLINMGHASQFVEGTRLKPPYDKQVRAKFYPSGYDAATRIWFTARLKALENPANKTQFRDEISNTWEPKSEATIDHTVRVVEHWRSHGGNNSDQSTRAIFYNETSQMQVVTRSHNSSDGAHARNSGLVYTPDVGKNFRGPGE